MTFEGRSAGAAVRAFIDHLNRLLVRTVTRSRLVLVPVPSPEPGQVWIQVAFRQGGQPTTAPLRTRFGQMGLFLGQVCESRTSGDGTYTLSTISYRYALTPEHTREPLLRWEYVRQPTDPDARWCRHHLQGPVPLRLADNLQVLLNDFHLPTGWVPIEEVLRFCIVDLGVRPLSPNWHEALTESRRLSSAAER